MLPAEQITHDFGSDHSTHPAPMEYISTRGGTEAVDFEGALFSGYAPDGGLFMPSCIPSLDRPTLQQWSHLSYPELVKEICFLFVKPELIPRSTLSGESQVGATCRDACEDFGVFGCCLSLSIFTVPRRWSLLHYCLTFSLPLSPLSPCWGLLPFGKCVPCMHMGTVMIAIAIASAVALLTAGGVQC